MRKLHWLAVSAALFSVVITVLAIGVVIADGEAHADERRATTAVVNDPSEGASVGALAGEELQSCSTGAFCCARNARREAVSCAVSPPRCLGSYCECNAGGRSSGAVCPAPQ